MLLNELKVDARTAFVQKAVDVLRPYWTFKGPYVDYRRSNDEETVVQFRLSGDASEYNTLNHRQLDDKMKNALHGAGLKVRDAAFEEIERTGSMQPVISYTVVFDTDQ